MVEAEAAHDCQNCAEQDIQDEPAVDDQHALEVWLDGLVHRSPRSHPRTCTERAWKFHTK